MKKQVLLCIQVSMLVLLLLGCGSDTKSGLEDVNSSDDTTRNITTTEEVSSSESEEITTVEDKKLSVTINSSELTFPFTVATLVEAGIVGSIEPKDEVGGVLLSDEDKEITVFKSEDGIPYVESISTTKDFMSVLGLKVGVSEDEALKIQKEYGDDTSNLTEVNKADEVDTEYTRGFHYGDAYIEYLIDNNSNKVVSLYVRYQNK